MYTVEFDIGDDLTYEVECTSYSAGTLPSRDDPGDGYEVELDDVVKVIGLEYKPVGSGSGNAVPAEVNRIDLQEFIVLYSDYHNIPLEKAENRIIEEVYTKVTQQLADDYDDREPDE